MNENIDRIVKGDTLTVEEAEEIFEHLHRISFDNKSLYDDLVFIDFDKDTERKFESLEEALSDSEVKEMLKGKEFIYYKG